MRNFFIMSLLLLVFGVQSQAAQLDPINIEIDPVVQRVTIPPPPPPLVDPHYKEYYVEIPLPQVTLSPADILTINVHFTNNKMLQVYNDPVELGFDFVLSNSDEQFYNGN